MKQKKGATGRRYQPSPAVLRKVSPFEELLINLYEAVEGCLSIDVGGGSASEEGRIIEIAV